MALSTIFETRVNAAYSVANDFAPSTPATLPHDYTHRISWASGTGVDQADLFWADERTVATGATDSLDMAGTLVGLLGGTVTFARIKAIRVLNSNNAGTANTTTLSITRPATNGVPIFTAAGDSVPIPPGGVFLLINPSAAGYAVTAGTGDLIDIINSAGASATYRVEIIGASA